MKADEMQSVQYARTEAQPLGLRSIDFEQSELVLQQVMPQGGGHFKVLTWVVPFDLTDDESERVDGVVLFPVGDEVYGPGFFLDVTVGEHLSEQREFLRANATRIAHIVAAHQKS